MAHDMKRRAGQWQAKRSRVKRVAILSGLTVLAVLCSVIWNLYQGVDIRWTAAVLIGIWALAACAISLSSYTNITLVAMYYDACYHLLHEPDVLEMNTGTIEDVHRIRMPYIGMLYQVTLNVSGKSMRLYCPGKLLHGLRTDARIRVLSHDLFAVRVESVESAGTNGTREKRLAQ